MSQQVNINLDDETATTLDRMAQADGYDKRSPFVRWLIRQEAARRKVAVAQTTDDLEIVHKNGE